jgi:Holliday junction resolvasome RuvABC ATP-dependent DNA helicase subunit
MDIPTAAFVYAYLLSFVLNMLSMQDWAIEKLSVFLGFDPETLREQVYPYLVSIESSNELVEHLTVSVHVWRRPFT